MRPILICIRSDDKSRQRGALGGCSLVETMKIVTDRYNLLQIVAPAI